MSEHTKEPWSTSNYRHTVGSDYMPSWIIADCHTADGFDKDQANARRIVACVNACAGIPTGHLELCGDDFLGHYTEMKDHERIVQQRDKLLALLKRVQDGDCFDPEYSNYFDPAFCKEIDAIIKEIEAAK